jgi:hypothetical protein
MISSDPVREENASRTSLKSAQPTSLLRRRIPIFYKPLHQWRSQHENRPGDNAPHLLDLRQLERRRQGRQGRACDQGVLPLSQADQERQRQMQPMEKRQRAEVKSNLPSGMRSATNQIIAAPMNDTDHCGAQLGKSTIFKTKGRQL